MRGTDTNTNTNTHSFLNKNKNRRIIMRDFGNFLQFLGCVVFMYFMLRPVKLDNEEE